MNELNPYIKDKERLQPLVVSDSKDNENFEKFSEELSRQIKNSVNELNNFFKIANIETDLK